MLRSSRTGPTKIGSLSRASAVIVGALVALFGVVAGPLLGVFAATSASAATSGSGYTAITPYRALGTSAAGFSVVAGTPVNVPTTVPAGATAAVLNVTASAPTSAGYLELYPQGAAPSSPTSNVNFVANETVANLVTVPVSASGGVTVANFAGTTAVDIDVEGYYSAAGAGLYNPVSPVRVEGTLQVGAPIAANTAVPVTVTGGTIPTTATAVVVNLTAAGGTAASYLSAYAAGATPATTSSLNFTAGETVANRDIVNVGTGGQIEVYNYTGSVNVDVDVDGYYAATGGAFVPLAAPVRVTDTRSGGFGPASGPLNGTSIASGGTETFNLATTASGIPSTASSVAANFTVVPGVAPGYITVFPTGVATAPTASDVNWPANSGPVANFTQPDSSAQVYNLNSGSPIDLVVDDFGYFTTSVPVNGTSVALSATPTSLVANGATSALVATVTNATTGPVSSDTVTFSSTGVCGTIAPASGSSSATGTVDATYTSSSSAGNCTITATESANGAASNPVVITQTASPTTYHTFVAASPNLVTTTGAGNTSVVTVTVTGPGNSPISGDQVEVFASNASASAFNTCGSLVAIPPPAAGLPTNFGTTGTNGQATFTYTSGSLIGNCTITAIEANQGTSGNTGTTAITQALQGYSITDVASPSAVIANGVLTTTITATVLDNGTPANADPVTFTFGTSDPTGTCGTFAGASTGTVNTISSGQASITYTSPNLAAGTPATSGFCPVIATASGVGTGPASALVDNQGGSPADVVAVSATPNIISAGGAASAVTAHVTGASNTGIVGDEVLFTVSGPCTITPSFEPTIAGGVTAPVSVAGIAAGTCTVTATESNSGKTGSTPITVNPIVNSVAVTASPSAITGNGITTSSITATVTGPSVAGDSVTFSVISPITGTATGCGTIPATPVIVNGVGQAVDTYTSSANAGFCIVTATESATVQSGSTQIDQTSV